MRRLALLALLVALAGPAVAQDSRPNAGVATEAISRLRSPYCPGLMLEVCPSPQAGLLRDSIYELAAQGMSADEIEEWMLARHGEEWRGVPKRSGAGLWAWLIPPALLLAGAAAVVHRLRAARARAPLAPEHTDMSEGDRTELAAALREWDER